MFHLYRVWCMRQQYRLTLVFIANYESSHYTLFFCLLHSNIIHSKLVSKDPQTLFFVESE